MQKISSSHIFIIEMQSILESGDQTGHTHFWPCPPKYLEILQSWLVLSWPISQEQSFYQIWDMCRNTTNNVNFHYRTNSVKINDQIFLFNSKNPRPILSPTLSLSIQRYYIGFGLFTQFCWKKNFFPKIWLSRTTLYGFIAAS